MHCKGAACKHLAPLALQLAKRFDDGSDHDAIKISLAESMVRIYSIMDAGSQFLQDAAKVEIAQLGKDLTQAYSVLSAEAHTIGLQMWRFTPKFHLLEHLCSDQICFGNPRYHSCYSDEDLVGLSIEVAESCHIKTMPITALCKWLILSFDVEVC